MSPARSKTGEKAEYAAFIQAADALGVVVVCDEPLARHCTFRIGGPADLYAAACDTGSLERMGDLAAEHGLPVTILGGGSNVLISDRGVRGLVIANQTREISLSEPDWGIVADSGVALAGLARWAIQQGLSGLEWAVSVPGTVGGAVIGNAGAHGGQIADNLAWVLVANPGSGRRVLAADEMKLGYRTSILKQQLIAGDRPPTILQVSFQLAPGNTAEMAERADSFLARRRASQPVEPSAGSIFRNPPGDHAGRLVEAVGLKGYRIGGVQVSPRHANFIINTGDGRAAEVAELIRLIQQRVFESTGAGLVPEILYVGDWTGST